MIFLGNKDKYFVNLSKGMDLYVPCSSNSAKKRNLYFLEFLVLQA